MVLRLEDKQFIVSEVNQFANQSSSVVAAEHTGVTVSDMTLLRKEAVKRNVCVRVIRNSLAKRAFWGTDFECMNENLVGPLFLAFSNEAPGAAARLLRDFSKKNENLKIKLVALKGQLIDVANIDLVANLPTKDEAIARLAYVVAAPVTQLARTLKEVNAKLVRVFSAVADQKKQTS